MDYEKRYTEALERAKEIYEADFKAIWLKNIFPELIESEDEKIRNCVIGIVKANTREGNKYRNIKREDILAWLEKWKPVEVEDYNSIDPNFGKPVGKTALEAAKEEKADNSNKVEPKFKKGKWIVWQNKCYKVNYNGCGYELIDQNGLSTSLEYGTIDNSAHLWTIQDAKEGDILHHSDTASNSTFIFKNIEPCSEIEKVKCYCEYDSEDYFGLNRTSCYICDRFIYPASKEQRNILFSKMEKAGYEWDADKKELKKIERKPVWSEEDKRKQKRILDILDQEANIDMIHEGEHNSLSQWLKSLKDRVIPQPKQEWSEEDNKRINEICNDLNSALQNFKAGKNIRALHFEEIIKSNIEWLKSLKPQKTAGYNPYKAAVDSIAEMCERGEFFDYDDAQDFLNNVKVKCKDAKEWDAKYGMEQWKPTKEQMEILQYLCEHPSYSSHPNQNVIPVLESLYVQLQKF